jgi:anti-sigma regulatory factor (Ser/Thr protein kinase)
VKSVESVRPFGSIVKKVVVLKEKITKYYWVAIQLEHGGHGFYGFARIFWNLCWDFKHKFQKIRANP